MSEGQSHHRKFLLATMLSSVTEVEVLVLSSSLGELHSLGVGCLMLGEHKSSVSPGSGIWSKRLFWRFRI